MGQLFYWVYTSFFVIIYINNVQSTMGPSKQPEAYFNGSSYLRLQTSISLKKQTGLSFRTCSGGKLFSQQTNNVTKIELIVNKHGVIFLATISGQHYNEGITGDFLNNKWYTVLLQYKLGNVSLIVNGQSKLIANSTYHSELLTSPELYNEAASVLLIGTQFNGCLLEGPSLVFDTKIIISNLNVNFGKCPIPEDNCIPQQTIIVNFCENEPCMRHGKCINGLNGYTCSCLPRYTGKNCEFDIGNPCDKIPPLCKNGGTCLSVDNNIDLFKCQCLPNFTGRQCETELKLQQFCKQNQCENGGTCIEYNNINECICTIGFIGQYCEINSNDCKIDSCKNNGKCIDGNNSFTCDCSRTGYDGLYCENNINECLTNPCRNQGICFDNYGGYLCQCLPGYDGNNCQYTINDCMSQPCLNQGTCINRPNGNGYECRCLNGYIGEHCEIEVHKRCDSLQYCNIYSDCIITKNDKQQCICKMEYPGKYPNCSITENNICSNNPCNNGGKCIPWQNGFNCTCQPGFTGHACEQVNKCTPMNQNYLNKTVFILKKCIDNPCKRAVNCRDYLGGYYCTCESGWTGINCNIKLRLCSSNPCFNNATCVNQFDYFFCNCAPGFTGQFCQFKVNSCQSSPCLNGGVCFDRINGYYCNCTEQWMGDRCEKPYDACELNQCKNNATCVISSTNKHDFKCECILGFEGDLCETNIDDCKNVQCPNGKVCIDLINDSECKCPSGYVGENCTIDLDICNKQPCLNGGTCIFNHTLLTHTCDCLPGYTGKSCESDINECETYSPPPLCHHGICINRMGGYDCYCKPGYTGIHCDLDFDECLSMPCQHNATCLNKVNNFECICPPGYDGKDCSINIDECESNPCMTGSTCIDGINEYTCTCQPGLTGKRCDINIDDCESSPCLHGGECIDGLNNYTCNCNNTGYMGYHCEINIDDCIGDPCLNGAKCIDGVKDYHCSCHLGYTGKNCEDDINECESNPCRYGGMCLEKSNITLYHPYIASKLNITLPDVFHKPFDYGDAAGYECLCVPGTTGRNCEININECESSPCFQGTCIDQINGYLCECDDGFEGIHCEIDIDECEKYKPCIYGTCIDKRANYYCECDQQYGGKNCSVQLTGCINNPCLNNGSCKPYLINENIHKFNCTCPHGYHGHICEKISTMSLSGNSLIIINTSREEGYDIQFRFKTTLSDGLLALGKGLTYYILELSKGRLNLHSSLLNKWEGVFIGSNLNDSNWQRVFVAINSSHLVLSANDEQTIYPITFNDYNSTYTSFPLTYIGGIPNNLRKLTHGQPFLVGCTEDVLINGEWILPEYKDSPLLTFQNIDVGCLREPQCNPNPCHSGGHCTDMWRDFKCTCERPYLGHTCQYNYTAATFGYENITDSLVIVNVTDSARRAVRTIVDISMFIRTRQARGQIFYLGSELRSTNTFDDTFIAARLEGGELLVSIQFNSTLESYAVGGVKLNNGYNHLIEVIRNITLVQVKLNGTEYFRKTISATGTLDAQVLYLGGQPQLRPTRQVDNNISKIDLVTPTVSASSSTPVHFKGIIQDVQISNGSSVMIVEFFPLKAEDLEIPMPFGTVTFNHSVVLEGVHSDDSCRIPRCFRGGTCVNTWNDYMCQCPVGYKGKDCSEVEFCELKGCPNHFECRNLDDGYECLANATFNGKQPPLQYKIKQFHTTITPISLDRLELTYRTRSWGTLLFAKYQNDYFAIFIYHNEVVILWNINNQSDNVRFRKDHFEGQWLTLLFLYKDTIFKGGFKDNVLDEAPNFQINDFNIEYFNHIFFNGIIYLAGSDNITFDYQNIIANADDNMTGYISISDTTTTTTIPQLPQQPLIFDPISEFNPQDPLLYKVDQNKKTDLFKGCLSEVRLGGVLIPFYKMIDLDTINTSFYFDLLSDNNQELGCILCYDNDCFNQGFCISPNETYKCNCTDGYTADDCSIDINECENNQCQNNATCLDLVAKYECQCLPGFEGIYCESEIDECLSDPCQNGGSCIDLIGDYKCECPENFIGKQCESPVLITCDNQPCKGGSTCKTGYNETTGHNFTCICVNGMEGIYCETPYCTRRPCENGYCNTTSIIPYCHCQDGFNGRFCENNIDDCITSDGKNPCQNNGICTDDIASFHCDCTGTGYTGVLCEIDIDECSETRDICGRGHCQNIPGTFRCICDVKGKCGPSCNLDDPCEFENPCIHGECIPKCTDKPDYICNCYEDYIGKNCSDLLIVAGANNNDGVNILYIIIPIVFIIICGAIFGFIVLVNVARSKRATRGTYSPSAQEFCNPRVELDHVLKPPPEERLI